jgi:hypothetical protein
MRFISSKYKTAALFILISLSATIQAADDWVLPRTVDGQADLQGVWANNSVTPVERLDVFGEKEFLTEEDVAFLNRRVEEIKAGGGDALFGNGVLAAAFSGVVTSSDTETGNYSQDWMAQRTVDPLNTRTSQIVDPPNGQYPPSTEASIALARDRSERRSRPAASWTDRSLGERCLSFSAPYLGSGYNSYWQIIQSKDHVVIVQEMAHDARIIPIVERPHIDDDIRLWMGDSRGYWDGDTLVVETTNFSDASSNGLDASNKVLIEKLNRIGPDVLEYSVTFNDPGAYTAPYTRILNFDKSEDEIYEYACHEGNYGMLNILSGARAQERLGEQGSSN